MVECLTILQRSWTELWTSDILNSKICMVIDLNLSSAKSEGLSVVVAMYSSTSILWPSTLPKEAIFPLICPTPLTFSFTREIHPLYPQPHRHSMLVPRVCAPQVTWCNLGKYWSRDWFRGNFSLTQGLWNQQATNPGVHRLSMTHSGVRQRNLMMHAQCPLPVYYSQVLPSL